MKSDLAKVHHARSAKEFPEIDLQEDEYVVLHIVRSKIGLFLIWAGEVAGFVALAVVFGLLASAGSGAMGLNDAALHYLYLVIFALCGLLAVSGVVGTVIYKANHLYITNRRVIQKARPSLFANSTNMIELAEIEDVSFRQSGILDYIMRIGTIRMSTVSDETTYTFTFVDTPRDEIKKITDLMRKAKEGKARKS